MGFIVRQPVFDIHERVEGYELNLERPASSELDVGALVQSVRLALDRLPPGTRGTVPCGDTLLWSDVLRKLPARRLVLALSSLEHSEEVWAKVRSLQRDGYKIALLDFRLAQAGSEALANLDVVGVPLRANLAELYQQILRCGFGRPVVVARQVATRRDWQLAFAAGFRHFHGEFFLTPAKQLAQEVPSSKLSCVELLKELRRPVLDHFALERLMKAEPSFCYRLMRYMNSAAFFGLHGVSSIRHAMTLLGDEELRRWLSLMATVAASEGRPNEAVVTAMLRARFCEVLSPEAPDFGFMTGLFSLMPLIVNMQLGALLTLVPLPASVHQALWGEPGRLRTVLDLSVAYERAQWRMVRDLANILELSEEQISAARGEASRWSNEILSAGSMAPVAI